VVFNFRRVWVILKSIKSVTQLALSILSIALD